MYVLCKRWQGLVAVVSIILGGLMGTYSAFAGNPYGADYFPNVPLTTQDGATVRFYDDLLKGKTVAINVIFTQCQDVCPLETAKLRELQKILGDKVGKDIYFYSISIDPKNDTPQVLKAYANRFEVGPGWLFLTGKPDDIKLITKKLGLMMTRDNGPRENHSSFLMVGKEPTGQWMKNSATDNPRFLAATMETFLGWKSVQPAPGYAQARPLSMTNGQQVFQNTCASCHTLGQGDKIGPDLMGVTERRERNWLTRYILLPDEVLASGDATAVALFKKYKKVPMPNLGLAKDEVKDVLSYIEAQTDLQRKSAKQ
jgi:protein SCO1